MWRRHATPSSGSAAPRQPTGHACALMCRLARGGRGARVLGSVIPCVSLTATPPPCLHLGG